MSKSYSKSQHIDPGGTNSQTDKTSKNQTSLARNSDVGQAHSEHQKNPGASSEDTKSQLSDQGFVDGSSISESIPSDTLVVPSDQNLDIYSSLTIDSCDTLSQPSSELISLDSFSSSDDALWASVKKLGYTRESYDYAVQKLQESNRVPEFDSLLECLVNYSLIPPRSTTNSTRASSFTKSKHQSTPKSSADAKTDAAELRLIVIDGNNVAMEHGNGRVYSCKGIEQAVRWFQNRGHKDIVVFVPSHRMKNSQRGVQDRNVLSKLRDKGVLVKTPSGRPTSDGTVSSYDDRFILKLAASKNAVVVSNDHYRDLLREDQFRETIEKRILPFTFYNDMFMPADDPQGRHGLTLDQLLRNDPLNAAGGVCPYGRKCTYGTKCKFRHPERETKPSTSLVDEGATISVQSAPATLKDSGYVTMHSGTTTSDQQTTSYITRDLSQLSVNNGAQIRQRQRFNMNRPTSMPLQSERQQPHSWGPGPTSRNINQLSYPYPASLPQTYQHHVQSAVPYPTGSPLPENRPHSTTNYHAVAHPAHQHFHPTHQDAYYSVPFDGCPNMYFNVEVPKTHNPLTPNPSQPAGVVTMQSQPTVMTPRSQPVAVVPTSLAAGSAKVSVTSGSRETVYNKLSKLFNPQLVRRVMDQHPDLTDTKQLKSIIITQIDDTDDES